MLAEALVSQTRTQQVHGFPHASICKKAEYTVTVSYMLFVFLYVEIRVHSSVARERQRASISQILQEM